MSPTASMLRRSASGPTGEAPESPDRSTSRTPDGLIERARPNVGSRRGAPRRSVGLEIADTVLRAVEVGPKGTSRGDVRKAELALPPGAVRHGDVLDRDAVAAGLRELWKLGGFSTRRVVIGIGNSDVVTRQLELADLGDADLRSALRYELGDMIPFAVEDSILDLARIGIVQDERGVRHARVLAVAALRESLRSLAGVARAAGLRPCAIDLTPFALVRAAATSVDPDHTEAIVHLGDSSIAVVVHRDGVPQFTRSLATGAAGAGISHELESELEVIEQYIERTSGESTSAGSATSGPVVSAIRGTLEYYAIQPGAAPIDRITLTGDNAWAAQIAPGVAEVLDAPVGLSDPLDPTTYQAAPFIATTGTAGFAAALGLALAPGPEVSGPAPLRLLPDRDQPTSVRALAARALAAAAAATLVLTAVGAMFGPDTGAAEDEARRADSTLATTKRQLKELGASLDAANETSSLSRRGADVAGLRIDWGRIMASIRAGFPADAELLSITARGPSTTKGASSPGTIKLTGQTSDQASISAVLAQLATIKGVTSPWLESARAGKNGLAAGQTTFSITMELDDAARIDPDRAARADTSSPKDPAGGNG